MDIVWLWFVYTFSVLTAIDTIALLSQPIVPAQQLAQFTYFTF
jgi:hypothetical protein